jgi:hypothetical protein
VVKLNALIVVLFIERQEWLLDRKPRSEFWPSVAYLLVHAYKVNVQVFKIATHVFGRSDSVFPAHSADAYELRE